MTKPLTIKSDFAILDVKAGRGALFKRVGRQPAPENRVPVTITGFIKYAWGTDDGTSQEFSVLVTGVKIDG